MNHFNRYRWKYPDHSEAEEGNKVVELNYFSAKLAVDGNSDARWSLKKLQNSHKVYKRFPKCVYKLQARNYNHIN